VPVKIYDGFATHEIWSPFYFSRWATNKTIRKVVINALNIRLMYGKRNEYFVA